MTVIAYGDFVDGTGEQLVVQTLDDGTVLINPPEYAPSSEVPGLQPMGTGECNDDYADSVPNIWQTRMDWLFYSASIPSYLGFDAVVADLRAGTANITGADNTCGIPDTISATSNYDGVSAFGVEIGANGTCLGGDGLNDVSFGDLPSNEVTATCNWVQGSERVESDIKFNKVEHKFTTGSCSGTFSSAFYVEGIMTHERGHTWNVPDFPSGHPHLTMGGANGECPLADQKRTLGLGDIDSLEERY